MATNSGYDWSSDNSIVIGHLLRHTPKKNQTCLYLLAARCGAPKQRLRRFALPTFLRKDFR